MVARDHDAILQEYLEQVQQLGPEPARAQAFGTLLDRLFGEKPGFLRDLLKGIERPVEIDEGALARRGRVDNLCGSLVVEFKRGLRGTGKPGPQARGKLAEAQEELRRYVAALWSEDKPGQCLPYLAMATDGLLFAVYTPLAQDPDAESITPDDVTLQPLTPDLIDLAKLHAEGQALTWLDRYFLRQVQLPPRTAEIVADFGLNSHAFKVSMADLSHAWAQVENEPEFAVLFESWDNYLRIAYGTSFRDRGGRELFLKHTYLATLAKLMVWARFGGGEATAETISDRELLEVLSGEAFARMGLLNFLEEDFFAWPTRAAARAETVSLTRRLCELLSGYRLAELNEDVFKGLYEQLVDPEGRHDLGEYYTPDWLAARVVKRLLDARPAAARALDPACGSGTFLYHAVLYKRGRLGEGSGAQAAGGLPPAEVLDAIHEQVVGIDVHPLAVIIAKANYLLALGDLLDHRVGSLVVPVYLANSIHQPPRTTVLANKPDVPGRRLKPDPQTDIFVFIPHQIGADPDLCDRVVDACRDYARRAVTEGYDPQDFGGFVRRRVAGLPDGEPVVDALYELARALGQFIELRRDTIQAYVLKNMLKPIFLRGHFDVIMGNPPWLSLRYIRTPDYQTEIRGLMHRYGLAAKGHLSTHLELAVLFLVRCADWYLAERGLLGLVLPRSVFTADQHDRFRAGEFAHVELRFVEAWDLRQVMPLFRVPPAVLIAEKEPGARVTYPIVGVRVAGRLRRRNASPAEAQAVLTEEPVQLALHRRGPRSFWAGPEEVSTRGDGPYRERFGQGASIVPRALWFVETVRHHILGADQDSPFVRTDPEMLPQAKPPWRGIQLRGPIEREFLWPVVLGNDIVPFGLIGEHLAVLPIQAEGARHSLLEDAALRRIGCVHMRDWLERARRAWDEGRAEKAGAATLLEWLDWRKKLTGQPSVPGCRVVYASSGMHVCAAALPPRPGKVALIESSVYHASVSGSPEAHYLTTALNAPVLDALLKPAQARGEFNPRHVCKKVFDVAGIPVYLPANSLHQRLSRLGRHCARKVSRWLEGELTVPSEDERKAKVQQLRAAIGHTRHRVREYLAEELAEIDELVKELLGL